MSDTEDGPYLPGMLGDSEINGDVRTVRVSTMPQRVQAYLTPDGDVVLTQPSGDSQGVALVPEAALLAAEARLAEVEAELDAERRGASEIARLAEAEIATLRAERDALVPLARLGLHALLASRDGNGMDGGDIQETATEYGVVAPEKQADPCGPFNGDGDYYTCSCWTDGGDFPVVCYRDTEATTTARALLARREKEGA